MILAVVVEEFISIRIKHSSKKDVCGSLFLEEDPRFFVVSSENGTFRVRLRKRTAYPTTYCKQLEPSSFKLGYGDKNRDSHGEFLEIYATPQGLRIVRDTFVTLPIFYGENDRLFVASDTYADAAEALMPVTLSKSALLESLAFDLYMWRPLASEVKYLREREILQCDGTRLRIIRPPDKAWQKSADAPQTNPKDFMGMLNAFFDYFITTRFGGQNVAFEVSGGLDSATLAQYYTHVHQKHAPFATMLLPGKQGFTQSKKLEKLLYTTGGSLITSPMDAENLFPMASMIIPDRYKLHYAHMYVEVIASLLDKLEQQGIEVIATGLGGDELFGNVVLPERVVNYGTSAVSYRRDQSLPRFVTDSFREGYIASVPEVALTPFPLRSTSVSDAQMENSIYIRRGMWPVSPFTDPELYDWCQGLPIQYRANKNILRAYHQAFGFVEDIYNPVVNEHPGDFFDNCLRSGVYDKPMKRFAEASEIARMGYVDIEKLLAIYEQAKHDSYPGISKDLFHIYLWLSAEINVQCIGSSRIFI